MQIELNQNEKKKLKRMEKTKKDKNFLYVILLITSFIGLVSIIWGIKINFNEAIYIGISIIIFSLIFYIGVKEQLKLYNIIEKLEK